MPHAGSVTSSRARTPSHLNSYAQPSPVGRLVTAVASMGCTRPFLVRHRKLSDTESPIDEGSCMRSIWKGSVSFGLVSIGVKLYSATEEKDVSFHQVRRSDGARIRYKRVAETDGEEVPYADIAKGYQLPSGETVVLTDEDFADLPLPSATGRRRAAVRAGRADRPDLLRQELLPRAGEERRQALRAAARRARASSDMVGVVKVAIRNREQLATLRVRDGVIVLETMIWPDEVREPDFGFLDEDVELRPQEQAMASRWSRAWPATSTPTQYTDDYREALQAVIEAKVEGREVVEAEEPQPSAGNVVDLMSALRASVEAAKQRPRRQQRRARRPEGAGEKAPAKKAHEGGGEEGAPRRPPAKKAPAKKARGGEEGRREEGGGRRRRPAKTAAKRRRARRPAREDRAGQR